MQQATPAASESRHQRHQRHYRHQRLRRSRHHRLPWVLLLAGLIALSTQILPAYSALAG